MRSLGFYLTTAALFGAATGMAACSSTQECTLVACESTATVRMRANVTQQDLQNATISACRIEGAPPGGCVTGTISLVPNAPGDKLRFSMNGPIDVRSFVGSPDAGKGYLLEFVFNLEGATTKDGDTYEIKVLLNNNPIAQLSERATYTVQQPNGADCPPVCRSVVIDKS